MEYPIDQKDEQFLKAELANLQLPIFKTQQQHILSYLKQNYHDKVGHDFRIARMATIAILIQKAAFECHNQPITRATKSMQFVLKRLSGDEVKKTIDQINKMVYSYYSPLPPQMRGKIENLMIFFEYCQKIKCFVLSVLEQLNNIEIRHKEVIIKNILTSIVWFSGQKGINIYQNRQQLQKNSFIFLNIFLKNAFGIQKENVSQYFINTFISNPINKEEILAIQSKQLDQYQQFLMALIQKSTYIHLKAKSLIFLKDLTLSRQFYAMIQKQIGLNLPSFRLDQPDQLKLISMIKLVEKTSPPQLYYI